VTSSHFHRNRFTWAAYGALLAFGFLNAVLGPILPYLRAVEGISYLVGALHQFAYAMGGGVAGLLAHRDLLGRSATIRFGLAGAAVAGLGVGFGDAAAITLPATLVMGFLNTAALIALWAALSDAHRRHRAVAMTEGEVAVSLGGIVVPLLVAALASTAATWRFALVIGAALVAAAVVGVGAVRVPEREGVAERPVPEEEEKGEGGGRWSPLLAVVFSIVALEFGLSFWLASYLNVSVGLERGLAVALVAALYGANLAGRLLASRLARRVEAARLLALALVTAMVGLPILIAAQAAGPATLGFVITGMGIGALFPLTSSLHVGRSSRGADAALGQVLVVAAFGQTFGPLAVAALAQLTSGCRTRPAHEPPRGLPRPPGPGSHRRRRPHHRHPTRLMGRKPDYMTGFRPINAEALAGGGGVPRSRWAFCFDGSRGMPRRAQPRASALGRSGWVLPYQVQTPLGISRASSQTTSG
jgi:MFS family permease